MDARLPARGVRRGTAGVGRPGGRTYAASAASACARASRDGVDRGEEMEKTPPGDRVGSPFRPPVAVGTAPTPSQRLVAWQGRDPSWTPEAARPGAASPRPAWRGAAVSVAAGTVVAMNPWVAALLGLLAGAGGAVALARVVYAARGASVTAERDLLRERVVDLEASLAEDLETAALLAPLKDALGRVEQQVGTLERDRVEQFGALRAVLHRVESETHELGTQTRSLAGSLRSSTTRGAWGEVQLRRVLESAGMLARCDFDEQVASRSHHGRAVRPDVVVRLPGDKVLVVDAKAPMTAFLDAQSEDLEEGDRARLLLEHAASLRRHVQGLAAREYWTAFDTTPEMVVCFVPGDAMLAAALAADPSLHEAALARRVALVGPAALMALLRTVAFTWQQDALTEGARELMRLGRELYHRLGTLGGHTAKMGRSLAAALESYNQLVGALESRVLVTARRMNELGLVTDELPAPPPVHEGPRVLTALELIEAATQGADRPQLDLEAEIRPGPHEGVAEGRAVSG